MRSVMNYGAAFLSTLSWKRGFKREAPQPQPPYRFVRTPDDTRQAVLVEQLEDEWIRALDEADYSHLPSKLPA